jgi:G3E family GTPase
MEGKATHKANPKVDIILITGFLGAGKTTLLKRMIGWQTDLSDTVVIVNEFGEIGLDGTILKQLGSNVIELASGCICCSLKVNLHLTLTSIMKQFHPRQILIECTGVADPGSVVALLKDPKLDASMKIQKVITVLDCDSWKARDVFGSVFYKQLKFADIVLLNKVDLVDKSSIPKYLQEIHEMIPHSQVVPTIQCDVDADILLSRFQAKGLRTGSQTGTDASDAGLPLLNQYQHVGSESPTPYVTFSFQDSGIMNEERFKQFAAQLPWHLFRMKGIVRFQDRSILVNHVGGKSEWKDWPDAKATRIAFVGWDADSEETLHKLRKCLVHPAK